MRGLRAAPTLLALLLTACGGGSGASRTTAADSAGARASSAATPVQMAVVESGTIPVIVDGPGATDAFQEELIRAPFTGVLVSLSVNVGDQVGAGQTIGAVVAQTSYAALQGAQSMARSARDEARRGDAQRALAVARENLVRTPLVVRQAGVVMDRSASPGQKVLEGDSIVSIEPLASLSFIANVAQSDIADVHAGDPASIDLVAQRFPISGTVARVLPSDTGGGMSVRVRIALNPGTAGFAVPTSMGLLGTAHIVVARRVDVPVVPRGALVRDDVNGTTRVAWVDAGGIAHWIEVTPGVSDSTRVEIVAPRLDVGTRVIVSGQVGLPDGARVVEAPAAGSAVGAGAPMPSGGGAGVVTSPAIPGATPGRAPPRSGTATSILPRSGAARPAAPAQPVPAQPAPAPPLRAAPAQSAPARPAPAQPAPSTPPAVGGPGQAPGRAGGTPAGAGGR